MSKRLGNRHSRERSGSVKLKIGGNLQGEPIFCFTDTAAVSASHKKGRDDVADQEE